MSSFCLLAALQISVMSPSTSNKIQTPFTAQARLISSQENKWEECSQSDTSNEILSSSQYQLNVNFDVCHSMAQQCRLNSDF